MTRCCKCYRIHYNTKYIDEEPCQSCKLKAALNKARVFWAIPNINGYTFPIEISASGIPRPFNIPTLIVTEEVNFRQITLTPDPTQPQFTISVLQYIGKCPATFLFNNTGTIRNDGSEAIKIDLFVALGNNGTIPSTIVNTIRESALTNPNGNEGTEAATGIIQLQPNDTLTLFFTNNQIIPANTLTIANFMLTLTEI